MFTLAETNKLTGLLPALIPSKTSITADRIISKHRLRVSLNTVYVYEIRCDGDVTSTPMALSTMTVCTRTGNRTQTQVHAGQRSRNAG